MLDGIHDRDERIERAALCSMLLSERAAFTAFSDLGVSGRLFGLTRHQHVLRALRQCYEEGQYAKSLCPLLLEARLKDLKLLDEVGGFDYLQDLYWEIPTAANLGNYVRRLEQFRDVRTVRMALEEAKDWLKDGDLDRARHALAKATAIPRGRELLKSASLQVEDLVAQLLKETKGAGIGPSTGFPRLDRIIGGFVPGRAYVLAGLTSVGKTALALQFVIEVAKQGRRVYVWSKEMHHQDCRRRMAAVMAGVPLPPGALKTLTEKQQDLVDGALKMLADLPIDIDDRPTNLTQMVAQAQALRGEVGLFVVDHARLVNVPDARNEYEAITAVSAAAKQRFAVECEAACLLLSQFNREAARDKDPKVHQLRGAGALEEDANAIMILTRKAYLSRSEKSPEATLAVPKNRDGKCGTVPLEWDKRLARYVEPMDAETRYADGEDGE